WLQQQSLGLAPESRAYPASNVYDAQNDRMIIFSGEVVGRGQTFGLEAPPDVWVLNHATGVGGSPTWIQLIPDNGGPAGRFEHVVAYDHASNRLIVQGGGRSYLPTAFSDTWALTNANGLGGTPRWIRLPDIPS